MASRILLAALLVSGTLGRALPEGREVANTEERKLTFVSCCGPMDALAGCLNYNDGY
ncbi:hypothetical protein IMZ48_28170 [Candidatus Bathyarchaeota archaeon]|nr:hypothetical protein [Candidatus Bathyarchaeota archaeon]